MDINHRQSGRTMLTVDADTLEAANLAGEYLIHADLRSAVLRQAQLLFANFSGADLSHCDLTGADMRGANLTEADLTGADMANTNLTGATLSLTTLHGCRNLHLAMGLDKVVHAGPSMLDHATLAASAAGLSNEFLRGAGFTWSEIGAIRRDYSVAGDAAD
jgi:uncharacterized protein YjbI with pentapeptide repeats